MTSTAPAPNGRAIAALVQGTEQSLKKQQQQQKTNGVPAAAVNKLSIGSKEVAPVATLPEEIPLENLKVVLPPVAGNGNRNSNSSGESCSSSDDDEVERRTDNGRGSVATAAATVAQDSETLVLGKNFAELSLAITEPEMDDEVTGDKEAYMAGVLARYRKTLVERTKFHLGRYR